MKPVRYREQLIDSLLTNASPSFFYGKTLMFGDKGIQAVSFSAALRAVSSAADAEWQHIYPPTYKSKENNAPPIHLFVGRADEEGIHPAVLVDSVQSFAHRISDVLQSSGIGLPDIGVKVGDALAGLHELPHRVYDAILRDSSLDGVPWRHSAIGARVVGASPGNADALWQFAPLTLLSGTWYVGWGDV